MKDAFAQLAELAMQDGPAPVLDVFAGIAIVGVGAYAIYKGTKSYVSNRTKVLPDVEAKIQPGSYYYLAYVDKNTGDLATIGEKMTMMQALAALGVSGQLNNNPIFAYKKFEYNTKYGSRAESELKNRSKIWGIYADSQESAKALAMVFGATSCPKVHDCGYYGHYHDSTHSFHIWYGDKIYY